VAHQQSEIRNRAWAAIARVTLIGTAASFAVSFALNYLLLFSDTLTPFAQSMITAIVLPIVIGAPLSFLLGYSLQEVRRYGRELTRAATHDHATEFLTGTAFSSIVDRRAASALTTEPRSGAFLVVDGENLRSINARYGLEWGEQALRLIASIIRSSVRSDDIVGRLGASEFGIFLPGATEKNAREVGERILAGVARVYLTPAQGEQSMLTASIAGVIFEDDLEFERMYRAAEQRLASAEESGTLEILHVTRESPAGEEGRTAH
jgi:diguanylate cyclase